jgi:hypothetical protein
MVVRELFARLGLKVDKHGFEAGDRLVEGVKHALEALLVYEGVEWLHHLIESTISAGAHLKVLSQQLGIAVEPLQELQFAAKLSGVEAEAMTMGLRHLAREAMAARDGSGEAAKAFSRVGVSVTDANGKLRPAQDLLGDLADRFAVMPDGTEKTALSMAFFGRSGAQMIPLLNQGRKGIAEMRQEFIDLGAEISGETAEAFHELENDQIRLGFAWQGIKNQIVVDLMPTLKELVGGILQWVKQNRIIIAQKMETVVKVLAAALKIAAGAVDIFLTTLKWLSDHMVLTTTIAGVLTGAFLVLKAGAIRAAVASGAAWAAAAAPLILIISLIAVIILMVQDLLSEDSLIIEGIDKTFGIIGKKIGEFINDMLDKIADIPRALGLVQEKIFQKPGKSAAGGLAEGALGQLLSGSIPPAVTANPTAPNVVSSPNIDIKISTPDAESAIPWFQKAINDALDGHARSIAEALGQ